MVPKEYDFMLVTPEITHFSSVDIFSSLFNLFTFIMEMSAPVSIKNERFLHAISESNDIKFVSLESKLKIFTVRGKIRLSPSPIRGVPRFPK